MQIVIDIDESIAQGIIDGENDAPRNIVQGFQATIADAIKKGTPLPKGHGRLIDQDRMIARLEAASTYFSDENTDAFDERLSYGFKEAAIKVAGAPTIIEADRK